jgi:hypothetical protein
MVRIPPFHEAIKWSRERWRFVFDSRQLHFFWHFLLLGLTAASSISLGGAFGKIKLSEYATTKSQQRKIPKPERFVEITRAGNLKLSFCRRTYAIPTSNQRILSMRRRHGRLVRIIMMSAADRTPNEEKDLRSLIRQAAKEICKHADGLFGTTTSAASDWQRRFVKRAGCIVIDEAGAAVHSEIMIPWRDNKRLILAGDSRQLPPVYT